MLESEEAGGGCQDQIRMVGGLAVTKHLGTWEQPGAVAAELNYSKEGRGGGGLPSSFSTFASRHKPWFFLKSCLGSKWDAIQYSVGPAAAFGAFAFLERQVASLGQHVQPERNVNELKGKVQQ